MNRRHPAESEKTRTTSFRLPVAAAADLGLVVSSPAGIFTVPLPDRGVLVVGRGAEVDVVVADASVSRRHAAIHVDGGVMVEDLGSTNGTRVNGDLLRVGQRAPAVAGTVIEVGGASLLVQRGMAGDVVTATPKGRTFRPPQETLPQAPEPPIVLDPAMRRIYGLLSVIGPSPLSILVLGETGVGKEVFAESVHQSGGRAHKRLVQLNCAALPESVLEGELFGYERGAFTGAVQARSGLFEAASGGTVFLDEIGEMPLNVQSKLLRVLESGEVLRLGARAPVRVDVRFLAATNRDLRAMVAAGTFRADLFFRINGMSITIPPLRSRVLEIGPLAERFVARTCARMGKPVPAITREALAVLEAYAWPGNVRELRNVIERGVTFCRGTQLTRADLTDAAPELLDAAPRTPTPQPALVDATAALTAVARESAVVSALTEPPPAAGGRMLRDEIESFERDRIVAALHETSGNQTRAAELLGVSRRTLINKIEAYAIARPRKR